MFIQNQNGRSVINLSRAIAIRIGQTRVGEYCLEADFGTNAVYGIGVYKTEEEARHMLAWVMSCFEDESVFAYPGDDAGKERTDE